jgi:hypothetical protein
MNLFLLSWDPTECAQWHCDKHVVKMILELVQMLYTTWHLNNSYVPSCAPLCKSTGNRGYRKLSNPNHPMAKWVRESLWNYTFTIKLAAALCLEFKHRYSHYHGCTEHVLWLAKHVPRFDNTEQTQIPQCMPDKYKVACPLQAYRNYYMGDKVAFASWSKRPEPVWWKPLLINQLL